VIFGVGVLLVALSPAAYRPPDPIHSLISTEVDQ
jgi:hypothetical protein